MGKKNFPYIEETYDVVVVGAGHAGCEASIVDQLQIQSRISLQRLITEIRTIYVLCRVI